MPDYEQIKHNLTYKNKIHFYFVLFSLIRIFASTINEQYHLFTYLYENNQTIHYGFTNHDM